MKSFDENLNYVSITDEKLGVYFECLKGLDQKRWFARETHLRNQVNIKTLDDESYKLLSKKRRGEKYISNIACYDILHNPFYADALFYTSMDQRIKYEGKIEHYSSDLIAQHVFMGEERYDKTKTKEL